MLRGYGQRIFMQRRIMGEHYIWLRGHITTDRIDLDRLVPDPYDQKIRLEDFDSLDEFRLAIESKSNG